MSEKTDEEVETYHFTVEVEDNREPHYSAADTFITSFIHTLHNWVIAAFWILVLGALLSLIGLF